MEDNKKKRWYQRIPLWIRIVICVLLAVVIALALYVNSLLDSVTTDFETTNTARGEEIFEGDSDLTSEDSAIEASEIAFEETPEPTEKVVGVVNLLLVGIEALFEDDDSQGRTDSVMIVTLNFDQGTMGVTSLMRDMYVPIPGYLDNRLNASFGMGGIPLLRQTVEQDFGVMLDGVVTVNFSGFQDIIDSMGGIEITLTEDEAYYLNHTNYISKRKNRNVVPGTQILNGNQALGYMRIRYVETADGTRDDFGRTQRQRTLMTAVFDRFKNQSATDLIQTATTMMKYIKTDLSKTEILQYVSDFASIRVDELQTNRLPVNGSFSDETVERNGVKMRVMVPNLLTNARALHDFIYGADPEELRQNYPFGHLDAE